MNIIVYHLVSGDAFFSGCALILLAVYCSRQNQGLPRRLSVFCILLGLLFVLLSAVPVRRIEFALLALLVISSLLDVFIFSGAQPKHRQQSDPMNVRKGWFRRFRSSISILSICLLCLFELSWRRSPRFLQTVPKTLIILADSVTAGIGENEATTWPKLIAEQNSLLVFDYSRMGATVGSQLKTVASREIPDGLILIELGGNDMLGSTSVAEFEADLIQLLLQLSKTSQSVAMFELPLPPTFNRFGMVQRKLALRYGVHLIPKQVFANLLATEGATLDTIHLSQTGHDIMAYAVWEQIQTAYAP